MRKQVEYNAELAAWNHQFAPAINHYLRSGLGYKTDLQCRLRVIRTITVRALG